jgi:hypothetical protein
MEAQEFLNQAATKEQIVRLAQLREDGSVSGRGCALIVDEPEMIAIMLEDCGLAKDTGIHAGDIVAFRKHPEAEHRIVGARATVRR